MEGIERPPIEDSSTLLFMQQEIDYYTGVTAGEFQKTGILRIFGTTESGNSVMLHVHDFRAYFYVQCPPGHMANAFNAQQLTEELNRR
jgi:DNA polymerase elongation subunit (family B)